MIKSFRVAGLLAFKSIVRGNLGVILLTIVILSLISLNLLFIPSLLQGLVSGANDQVRNNYSGDIVIESDTTGPLLSDVGETVKKIEAIDGVAAVTSRNSLGAEIIFGSERTNTLVYGIQPDREAEVFSIHESIIEGSYLSAGDTGILLGIQIAGADNADLELYARSLQNVHAGDEVVLSYGNGVQKKYTVAGIFYTEFIQTDIQALIPQEEMQSVNPATLDRAVSLHIKLEDGADADSVIAEINEISSGLKILKWEDYAGIIRSMTDSFNVINAILNVVNLMIAGITVFIITYIDVVNRRRQIGVQRAIGITPASITISYLMRAVFYALIAIAVSILIFIFVVVPVEAAYPFHFPIGAVYISVELPIILRMTAILLIVSVIASFLPVRRVMKMKIMDAIWG